VQDAIAGGAGAKLTAWIITDGKAGDEVQCVGVAEALGARWELRRVAPRPPFLWLMPRGPIDPREAPHRPGSPLAPPFPDIAIASGRRAVPYLRALRRAAGARTFTVFLKDPRTGTGSADLIWVPTHDGLRGANVIVTTTAPHGIRASDLEALRAAPDPRLATLPAPRVAVLVGGDSRHHRFTPDDIARFLSGLDALAASGRVLMITASRRTPPPLRDALAALASRTGGFFWDGSGTNPYRAILALAEHVVVTADSTNMVGEAAVTGRPLLVFEPSGGHAKITQFLRELMRAGVAHPFQGRAEGATYAPIDATPLIAQAIRAAMADRTDNAGGRATASAGYAGERDAG
jgi:mitochondrial fission protein ELM1